MQIGKTTDAKDLADMVSFYPENGGKCGSKYLNYRLMKNVSNPAIFNFKTVVRIEWFIKVSGTRFRDS